MDSEIYSNRQKKFLLAIISTLAVMAGATIAPALPLIENEFRYLDVSAVSIKLILTLPAFFIAALAPFVGIIIDRFGRRPCLLFSIVLFGCSGIAGFFINSFTYLLISRAILGIAVAGTMTTSTTLIADYFSGSARRKAIGIQATFMAFSGVFFLIIGGLLADYSWQAPFLIFSISFILIPFTIAIITKAEINSSQKESNSKSGARIQWGTILLLYGLGFLLMTIFYSIPIYIPFYLRQMGAVSNLSVGLTLAIFTFAAAIASMLYSRIKSKLGYETIFLIVFIVLGSGYFMIARAVTLPLVYAGLITCGLGIGLFMPNMSLIILSKIDERRRGRVVGGLTFFIFIGQFLSPVINEPIFQQRGIAGIYNTSGFILFSLALILLLLRFRRYFFSIGN